ncbi:MAG: HEAT repeat domain-containing protein [Candidatus Thorarchaeota archaeon]|nr:HEAT repeat domain-containing protein [Candidatus Thorarchaeota archaeon]
MDIDRGDYVSAFSCLDNLLMEGTLKEFTQRLGRILEWDGSSLSQLKIRDCIADYLDFGPVYFALLRPSYEILGWVAGASDRGEAQSLLAEIVIQLVEDGNFSLDLSFIEIDVLTETRYVVLVPYVLTKRAKELGSCRILYSPNSTDNPPKMRYCLVDLLRTHYGRKILTAFKFDTDYPVLGKSEFQKLGEALQSFSLDVGSMLVEVTENEWPKLVTERMQHLESYYKSSSELWLLYKTYLEMIRLGSDVENERRNALQFLLSVGTKHCNDALPSIIANDSRTMRINAIGLLQQTHDINKVDFLCEQISKSQDSVKMSIYKAISTIESAQYFMPGGIPPPVPKESKKPLPSELTERYREALDQLTRATSSAARIDAVRSLSAVQVPGVESYLCRLMHDEDYRVRLAVLEASLELPRDQAVKIIRIGLRDEDPAVEKKAMMIMDERWPDSYW